MKRVTRGRNVSAASLQTLEDRRMLAVFGNVWPNQRDLTISFPSDGVQIGSQQNDVNALLDTIAQRDQWQELALRAYQTWAVYADINVGLRNDYNNAFGAPGLLVGDPRFGEFRIGAFPQEGLVANSVPFQAVAGTYSGDLVLNSNEQFTFHDWADNQGPDPTTLAEGDRDLFSLLLHETGNTLGLDDNLLDWSVMFRQYTVPKGVLSAEDIEAITALYGQRSDPYEQLDNGSLYVASLIPTPVGLDPQTEVIRSRGSLSAGNDVDYYKIVPITGADSVTLRVRASGVSLLQSRLEVINAYGQVIDQTDAVSVFENDNELTITGIANQGELYLRVSAVDSSDVYAVGDYWVEVDYRGESERAGDLHPGAYDSGPDTLFAHFDLTDDEFGLDDHLTGAMEPVPSETLETKRYEIQSSVSSAADVDYIKITAPETIEGRLVVHVAGVGAVRPDVRLNVVDAQGQSVGASARLHADGTFTVEVAQPQASQDYFVKVSVDPNSTVDAGNYVAIAEFESPQAQMNDLAGGELTGESDKFIRWTAGKTRLYRFDLNAASADADQAVRLTVYDAHTREIKMVAVAHAGITRTTLAWLQQGEYILRFTAISTGTAPVTQVSFALAADGISDDQDEDWVDPADDPNYDPYYYHSGEYDEGYYESGSEYYYYEYYPYYPYYGP
ncbi:Matrixin [Stieleria neptunia]|uniref:Matrixin n=1 Tax=Stieleria neptunia TaxID=2527979 RepID=A0A518I3I6_9BACT|nr:matrixin family metalloprotease [Stieleria neptunia]QDV47669.1 Matrixin [Stieleria neptunia]